MKVSREADYALRALFSLAERYPCEPVSIRELAERNDVPKRFLEQIMLDLKAQGWVESVAGKKGGYRLARSPDRIFIGHVVRHFDGLLAPIACVSASRYEACSQEAVCRFRRVFLDIRNDITVRLDGASLASMMRNAPVRDHEVFDDLMIAGAGI